MLHNDNYNRREYVVKILLKNIEGLTVDDAVNVMQVSAAVCQLQVVAREQDLHGLHAVQWTQLQPAFFAPSKSSATHLCDSHATHNFGQDIHCGLLSAGRNFN